MLVLAIETSCDETSAAVVADGRLVRSSVVASQIALHAPFGGVVPEIASRQHVRVVDLVTEEALRSAAVDLSDLDAVAATQGPGLAGALLVGLNFGRGLSLGLDIPFLPVNHLEGHLHSVWLTEEEPPPPLPELPMLALVVSGGHTELVLMLGHGEYTMVGRTLDDAAGEAFDKVARLLGLPYPGGPAISAAAGNSGAPYPFPRAWMRGSFDFSFSGLKTAALHAVQRLQAGEEGGPAPGSVLTGEQVADLAAGFQESVVDVLATKTAQAAGELDVRSVALVGGVAANQSLRQRMGQVIDRPLFISAPEFSTDNAAMIGAAAFYVKPVGDMDIDVRPGLSLAGA